MTRWPPFNPYGIMSDNDRCAAYLLALLGILSFS